LATPVSRSTSLIVLGTGCDGTVLIIRLVFGLQGLAQPGAAPDNATCILHSIFASKHRGSRFAHFKRQACPRHTVDIRNYLPEYRFCPVCHDKMFEKVKIMNCCQFLAADVVVTFWQ
jgi:hypothetical protein